MSANRIRELNDVLRTSLATGHTPVASRLGKVVTTAGIAALDLPDYAAVLTGVGQFSNFNRDNDPYGEHDFGSFEHDGERVHWRISYYDRENWENEVELGSDDPADPTKTFRILTIMFASED